MRIEEADKRIYSDRNVKKRDKCCIVTRTQRRICACQLNLSLFCTALFSKICEVLIKF